MEPQAKYTYVGAVVVLLTVLIVVAVLWLAEVGGVRGAKNYSIYFKRHALNGLQVDSAVTMRGIKVGTVRSLEISPQNIERIHVVIVLDGGTPVKTDTVAVINRNFLTGFASLDLARSSQEAPLLLDAPEGEAYPVIPEANSELDKIADSVPNLMEKVGELSGRVSSTLSEENIRALSASLKNIEEFTSVLAHNKSTFEKTLTQIQSASEQFSKVSQSLSKFTAENDGRLAQVSDSLLSTLTELQQLIATFRTHSESLMRSLATTTQSLSQQATSAAQNVNIAAQATTATLENYQQPRAILTGPHERTLGPGEGGKR